MPRTPKKKKATPFPNLPPVRVADPLYSIAGWNDFQKRWEPIPETYDDLDSVVGKLEYMREEDIEAAAVRSTNDAEWLIVTDIGDFEREARVAELELTIEKQEGKVAREVEQLDTYRAQLREWRKK